LQRWKKRLEETPESEKPFPGKGNPRDEKIDKLRRELARWPGSRRRTRY
jgi:hypothetical protein